MINNIEILNVNFGDCFICRDDSLSARMLVDYGSTKKISNLVVNEVNSQLTSCDKKYLMISHFHNDHYSGIKYLNSSIKFDEIYFPNFFSESIIRLQYAILLFLRPTNRSYEIAHNMLSAIPGMLSHLTPATKIIFARRGDKIINNIDSLRVLWPDNIDYDSLADRTYRELISFYDAEEKQGIIEEYVEEYLSILPQLSADENNLSFIELSDNQLGKLPLLNESLNNLLEGIKPQSKRLGIGISKSISSFQNSICLCFDNFIDNNDRAVLFLSDIYPNNFYNIRSGAGGLPLANHYRAIKVLHHGTKNHFVDNLPNSDNLIISNGDTQNLSWRITALYGWQYHSSNFICTNYTDTCDYDLTTGKCRAYKPTGCACGISVYYNLNI